MVLQGFELIQSIGFAKGIGVEAQLSKYKKAWRKQIV
jgi:hypothetical protein